MTAIESISIEVSEILNRVKRQKMPEVYINTTEVCRLLMISNPTLISFTKEGLLTEYTKSNNKYLLEEVLWLRDQNYRGLGLDKFHALIQKKKAAFA